MNISTDGMIAAIRSAAERVEPRESEVLNSIADRIAELVASANKNRRTAKHYERECLERQGKYNAAEEKLRQPVVLPNIGITAASEFMPDAKVIPIVVVHGAIQAAGFVVQEGN
ncbi:hypothetical protein J8Z82_18065 [Yersinia enterocolitica]|uniref:hypothetical protein n=1 Tax=Yersinia enterocolitica TaxID=630 RepID=UPI001C8D6C06|nr:hypothetical protein [Yersinia enterocolitica]MBX9487223.1 hypothetical protein [Yersinia enterocolitica]MBX9493664.1 hypothetical protein [Yersinia enterocolitica]